ncbi:MAG: tetratricopeptide (TPR) repeat protein, partial [Planctomycetota bacterium]
MPFSRSRPLALLFLIALTLVGPWTPDLAARGQDGDLEALLQEERDEAALLSRRGEYRKARKILLQHLEDEPEDAQSAALLARVRLLAGDLERAETRALEVLEGSAQPAARRAAAAVLCDLWIELGRGAEALAFYEGGSALLSDQDFPGALRRGLALESLGRREQAQAVWGEVLRNAAAQSAQDWPSLLAKGQIEQRLGRLVPASRSVAAADELALSTGGAEPDILAALGALYFESEREVNLSGKRSAAKLFREALALHPSHEGALLGLYELHRYNRRRQSQSPESFLVELLAGRPGSIGGQLARAGSDLSDGRLKAARATLALLAKQAPGRRERVALEAALAWVEHRREACLESLDGLLADAPGDSLPERSVGRMLIELYRFSEALPFLERATERNPADYEALQLYAGALANVGREDHALRMLDAAVTAAAGRKDAKRDNLKLVLERMAAKHVREDYGELIFSWQPDAAEVLRTYLVPFYSEARTELAERYGFTPEPTTIEVFRDHEDFSVRSVGFAGFPALGVCFGPVVTAVSPLSGLRGKFSWARTGFHEFSHVVHLGLSHNRCPRWITEGLATWEEVRRSPSWTRNMRRDLIDARAGDDLIPVRQLNRAFRGPRILFGYYQGGLLCEMLIAEHGFPPMIRLLEAFDDGLDLDDAFQSTFGRSPEDVDR